MKIEGFSLVGFGREASGATFHAFDPQKGQEIETPFFSATAADIEKATALAEAAAPAWVKLSGAERQKFLSLIADKLMANVAVLAECAMQETALPKARCESEIARTAGQLHLYGEAAKTGDWLDVRIETAQPERKPLPKPDHRSMMRPLGPVVVFGSSNFPFAYSVAGGDTASAFAAGCPVIVKAHPAHPGTSELVGRLIVAAVRECGLPEGSFSLLFDGGTEIGQALVKHPRVKAVGFTGSLKGGRALTDLAAARPEPIPVYAEMGSVNPVFLLPEALTERSAEIVEGLLASATTGVGQFCTNPGLVILERSGTAEKFVEVLVAKLAATPEGAMLTPGIRRNFVTGTETRGKRSGVRDLVRAKFASACGAAPVWFQVNADDFLRDHSLSEEIFGPSSLVIWCNGAAEMFDAARHLEGTLTATLHTGKAETAAQKTLVDLLAQKAGRVILNGYPTGLEVSHAIVHGGPYPSTSDGGRSTSVGTRALNRWGRLICYQNFRDDLLPPELQEANPLKLRRLVNGQWKT